ncbi:hypothetical protein K435DRAFT_868115 [Dendrothele bispora CBS 962.96]|uniref:DUF659 domain-containing protein n=1 Tax=Dendrothele bispora (strain CBS 962.96) TaxID=1314807 RepID=A0A4S8LCH1_DENBC|nr:hypothetical protein K435DRAFT_868115 [Dendrothele bispora CBS 962.96]
MVNMEYQPHLLNVTDISSKLKTAESLLDIVLKEIKHVQNVLMVFLVAWCTDCSGESAKMRRLLCGVFPWIIVLDCWAHQFILVVGDVLKLKLPLIKVVDHALETIKCFLSHSIAVGLLNEQQKKADFPVILMLILPVLMRWTTHYLALDCLLTLKEPLQQLVLRSTPGAKPKAKCVVKILSQESFWKDIKVLRDLLKPFAIATNAAQSDRCQLDTILLLLGYLYHIHNNSHINAQELMDAADEVENDADDSDSDSGDDIGDEKDRLIQNLFDYPSLSDPDSQTFLFMTEFWRRGEATLRAEVELHESLTSEIPLDTDNRSESDSDI